MSQPPRAPNARFDSPPPNRGRRLAPAVILAGATIAAAVILGTAVRDSAPPQLPQRTVDAPIPTVGQGAVVRTPNDPAQWVP